MRPEFHAFTPTDEIPPFYFQSLAHDWPYNPFICTRLQKHPGMGVSEQFRTRQGTRCLPMDDRIFDSCERKIPRHRAKKGVDSRVNMNRNITGADSAASSFQEGK